MKKEDLPDNVKTILRPTGRLRWKTRQEGGVILQMEYLEVFAKKTFWEGVPTVTHDKPDDED